VKLIAAALVFVGWVHSTASARSWKAGYFARDVTVLGFTDDARYLVFTAKTSARANVGVVLDVRTGATQEYSLGVDEAWDTWLASHPPAITRGRTSADGKTRIDVKAKVTFADEARRRPPSWNETWTRFVWGGDDAEIIGLELAVTVTRGKKKKVTVPKWTDSTAGVLVGYLDVVWSPDGKRVALLVHRDYAMLNDFGYSELLVVPVP
jgi:hypothetical protein